MTQTAWQEQEWWENTATDEDLWNGPGAGVDEHLAHIVPALEKQLQGPGRFCIDLGCGAGRLLVPMAEAFPWASFTGIDIMPRAFPRPHNVGLMVGDGRSLLLADETIDAAYSVLLFQHLPEDAVRDYIIDVFRALKPGGAFVFQFVAGPGDEPDGFLHHRHAATEVHGWCGDAGFSIITGMPGENDWYWITADKGAAHELV